MGGWRKRLSPFSVMRGQVLALVTLHFFRVFRIRDLWCWLGPLPICFEGCIISCTHHDTGHHTLNLLEDLESLGCIMEIVEWSHLERSLPWRGSILGWCKWATPRTWPSLFSLRPTIFLPPILFCPLREEGICIHHSPWTCTKTLRFQGLCPYSCWRQYCIWVRSDVMIT